jgi:NAD(P)H-flavin reductase
MERTALLGRLTWQLATLVARKTETPRDVSLTFEIPNWPGHLAGQHVDVRLTAEDGYQAERSYSIASPPGASELVTLTVERLDDGEVSPYLGDDLRVADQLELRGPIGGYFIWEARLGATLARGRRVRHRPADGHASLPQGHWQYDQDALTLCISFLRGDHLPG